MKRIGLCPAVALTAALALAAVARAADIAPDSLKLAPGVAKAAGYEAPATTYIVANSTNIYSGHTFVDTKVTGELKRGDRVEVLAKVKGWSGRWLAKTEQALVTCRYRCCRRQINTFREPTLRERVEIPHTSGSASSGLKL